MKKGDCMKSFTYSEDIVMMGIIAYNLFKTPYNVARTSPI